MYVSIDKRMAFESNCPVKAFVICYPLGKIDIFKFSCFRYIVFYSVFFCRWGKPEFWIFGGEHKSQGEGAGRRGIKEGAN